MLQALREEPPLNTKCKDKFLIQSTIITPDQENLSLHDLVWTSLQSNLMTMYTFLTFSVS